MKEKKTIKLHDGSEVVVTGLPMDKGIELQQRFYENNKSGKAVQSMLDFANFVEMKKCFIPVLIKKKSEDFEDGHDFYIGDTIVNFNDLEEMLNAIIELSFGKDKADEMRKKAEEGKDTTLNG